MTSEEVSEPRRRAPSPCGYCGRSYMLPRPRACCSRGREWDIKIIAVQQGGHVTDTNPTPNLRNLPKLLREAERRVNQHVWGDRQAIVSIPADRDRDVDMLLLEAADALDTLRQVIEQLHERLAVETAAPHMHEWIDGTDPEQQVCRGCDSTRMTPAETPACNCPYQPDAPRQHLSDCTSLKASDNCPTGDYPCKAASETTDRMTQGCCIYCGAVNGSEATKVTK